MRGFGGVAVGVFPLDFESFVDHREYDPIYDWLAELFDEVQHQRGFAGAIDVQESGKGFKSCECERAPDLGVQYPVAVVEQCVDIVGCTLMVAGGEASGGQ